MQKILKIYILTNIAILAVFLNWDSSAKLLQKKNADVQKLMAMNRELIHQYESRIKKKIVVLRGKSHKKTKSAGSNANHSRAKCIYNHDVVTITPTKGLTNKLVKLATLVIAQEALNISIALPEKVHHTLRKIFTSNNSVMALPQECADAFSKLKLHTDEFGCGISEKQVAMISQLRKKLHKEGQWLRLQLVQDGICPDLIIKHRKKISSNLKFKRGIRKYIKQVLYNSTQSNGSGQNQAIQRKLPTVVTISIDRKHAKGQKLHNCTADFNLTSKWYRNAIQKIESVLGGKRKNMRFMVITDDLVTAKAVLPKEFGPYMYASDYYGSYLAKQYGSQALELALLVHSNASIIDFGQAGFWGAVLNEGPTVYFNYDCKSRKGKANLLEELYLIRTARY